MSMQDHIGNQPRLRNGISPKTRAGIVLLGFLAIAGALLFTEHRAHVVGLFLWLPLAACPLMHFFMHHDGHGHGGDDGRPSGGT